jgi:hypothetical protein
VETACRKSPGGSIDGLFILAFPFFKRGRTKEDGKIRKTEDGKMGR